ncbi:MAG: hypothetical protein QOJ07_1319 [Thermoleophilaceae bacterium]|nr:hypothetical protein [Thermoleophilaceae bacterium]
MERGRTIGAIVIVLVLAAMAAAATSPATAATPGGFQVGAAKTDTDPPAFDAAADRAAFPSCGAAYDGPRLFALQEPYVDLNGSGFFDYPEPYCDANGNGHYDGLYLSGAVGHLAKSIHDPIDARAIAITSRGHTVVVVSVVAQGLFENYIEAMRAKAKALRPGIDDVIVSANHNESSPDTVGIYGAPDLGGFGANSGIDEYYMGYLEDRVAQAAADAYDARVPARLYASQFPLPDSLRVQLSHNFPTTDDQKQPAAIDPKVGVLQARDRHGRAITTVMSLAAHNQEIGHSGTGDLSYQLSSDWPGYFHRRLEGTGRSGLPVFLVGDNGSEEDPETVPAVSRDQHPECSDGCYAQAQATGERFAGVVSREARRAEPLRGGALTYDSKELFVPLENNLFKAAAAAGLFGQRQTYSGGQPAGRTGDQLRTSVSVLGVGPDLQLLMNPGEAFPALMVGSPWGIEDAGCPDRPNPAVPTWHARARYRFQVGLANDKIGYEIPAWAYSSQRGALSDESCVNDDSDKDPKGHQHKLETEGVGPTASNTVADELTKLLAARPDPVARYVRGRFLKRDGSLSRSPRGAVGILIVDGDRRQIVAKRGIRRFGGVQVAATGVPMDYDGQPHRGADLTTRGMLVRDRRGRVTARWYVDVYPALDAAAPGPASR